MSAGVHICYPLSSSGSECKPEIALDQPVETMWALAGRSSPEREISHEPSSAYAPGSSSAGAVVAPDMIDTPVLEAASKSDAKATENQEVGNPVPILQRWADRMYHHHLMIDRRQR